VIILGGTYMKCPMKYIKNVGTFGECEEDACAWWDVNNKCCSLNCKSTTNVDAKLVMT